MKAFATRYLNEIVGLAVLALMTVALIAGQADATLHQSVSNAMPTDADPISASISTVSDTALIRADIDVELNLDRLIDLAAEEHSRDALKELIRINLDRRSPAAE